MFRISLTGRLTTLFAATSVAVLVGFGTFISSAIEEHFSEQDQLLLQNELQLIQKVIEEKGVDSISQTFGESLHNHPDFYVDVRDINGKEIYSTLGSFRDPILSSVASSKSKNGFDVKIDAHREFQVIRAELKASAGSPVIVVIAVDKAIHTHFMSMFRTTLMLYVLVAAIATVMLGWWAARQGLSPLRTMAARAQTVTSQNMNERMPVDAVPTEMTDLAVKLNAMLDRLQNDIARLTEFSADLAHELRTPISNMLTQTHVVLNQSRSIADYRDSLSSNAEELQRLGSTISDMLFLAQTENGLALPSVAKLNMARECQALLEFYEALAEEKKVVLRCEGDAVVIGDQLMFRRALNNLLSNAIRYTPSYGTISIKITSVESGTTITVQNDGEEIPAEIQPHLFDRFFRADKSRKKSESDSAGLGLSITRAIMQAHGGSVSVVSRDSKTAFSLYFPSSPRK